MGRMDALPTFDASMLQMLGNMAPPSFVSKMIDMYLTTTEPQVNSVDRAAREGDWGVAAFAAHSLKSSSGNLGLPRLSEAVTRIDEAIRSGDLDQARLQAALVRPLWEEACSALREFRTRL